jgi:hypothetical protein
MIDSPMILGNALICIIPFNSSTLGTPIRANGWRAREEGKASKASSRWEKAGSKSSRTMKSKK